MNKVFLVALMVVVTACKSQKPPEARETAAPTPPSNVVSAYGQNLAASVEKAKTVTAKANNVIATTNQETQKALSE